MPDAIAKLLDIMRDETASPRDRINAAVSASRVQKLQLPGEEAPESITYLRNVIEDLDFATNFRREAAAAVAYFERRSKMAALNFEVADTSEQRRVWQNLTNAALRSMLACKPGWPANRSWPDNRDILASDQTIPTPTANPEPAIAALLLPPIRRTTKRGKRHIDDPGGLPTFPNERERRAAIMPVAAASTARIAG